MENKPACAIAQSQGNWHLRAVDELLEAHGVEPATGLQAHQVRDRTLRFGANAFPGADKRSVWSLILEQFNDVMILVLLAAAVISGLVGDLTDTLVIAVIAVNVVLNAAIALVQSWRADHTLAALQRLAAAQATVLRGGMVQQVPAQVLVPGDIVLLEAGNDVPADMRLIQTAQLKVDESALTGESVTVDKHADVLEELDGGEGNKCAEHALGDRFNMAFKGTTATHGRAHGLVVATGMATELGKVAALLGQNRQNHRFGTPLQQRLAAFGRRAALAVIGICSVIFVAGVLRGEAALLLMMTATSLAVAAIPEALPAVVTVLLALGARKMVSVNALIRRLPSVETMGSVTFICSDKTATLTQNRMQAQCLLACSTDQALQWMPQAHGAPADAAHLELLQAAALCNDASAAHGGTWAGDPTETALTDVAALAGLDKSALDLQWPRVMELPFDSVRKCMTTVHRAPEGSVIYANGAPEVFVAYTKGAPEAVIALCSSQWPSGDDAATDYFDADAWLAVADALAAQGLRVLAIALRSHQSLPNSASKAALNSASDSASDSAAIERDLYLIGLIGLFDPPRPKAAAVRECLAAGITPVMITGDHPATARAIALRLGIVSGPDAPVLSGADLARISDNALMAQVHRVCIYARVDPA